ncbi:hypothetical protein HZH66_013340 [Vespula vulgaris]|uniref:Uncharacterized protein n=1 Tax=Vespula vulgaris TaxID=7454 RepID=A0A834MU06_VESVU|nr:hypothetical protein HZH66_013340 [Vespula vulgaris]
MLPQQLLNPDSNMNWNVHFQSFVIEGRDKLKSLDHYSLFTIQIGIGNNVANGEGSRFIINNINNVDKLIMRPGLLLTLIDLNNKVLFIQDFIVFNDTTSVNFANTGLSKF